MVITFYTFSNSLVYCYIILPLLAYKYDTGNVIYTVTHMSLSLNEDTVQMFRLVKNVIYYAYRYLVHLLMSNFCQIIAYVIQIAYICVMYLKLCGVERMRKIKD